MSDDGFTFADQNTQRYPAFAVRQTVTNGPVDATGQSAFGGATGGTTITMTGTLEVNAANGVTGRRGSKVNASWSGLVTNGTMFMYVDVNANGTLTEGVGTLLRAEQPGGTPSIAAGQHTFNWGEMVGYIGNGAAAVAGYRLYVGECTVAGGIVTAIIWYALNGRAYGTQATLAVNTTYGASNHNIASKMLKVTLWLECVTADGLYIAGDRIGVSFNGNFGSGGAAYGTVWKTTRNTFALSTLVSGISILPNSSGSLTTANWSAGWLIERGF